MKLCEEVTTTQRDIDRRYNHEAIKTVDKWDAYQDNLWMGTRKLGSLADSFTIFGANDLSAACSSMREAAYAIAGPAKQLRSEVLAKPNAAMETLPGWQAHWDSLTTLSEERKAFVKAATEFNRTLRN